MATRKPQKHREALHQLLRARPALDRLLDSILTTGATEGSTTVDELLPDIPRKQAVGLLRDLEGLGYGKFRVGRKGYPSRFEWSTDPEQLRKLLDDEDPEPAEPAPPEPPPVAADKPAPKRVAFMGQPATLEPSSAPPKPPQRRSKDEVEHLYLLRPNYRVSLNLPKDLTPREAEVLGDWVRDLSFQR